MLPDFISCCPVERSEHGNPALSLSPGDQGVAHISLVSTRQGLKVLAVPHASAYTFVVQHYVHMFVYVCKYIHNLMLEITSIYVSAGHYINLKFFFEIFV